MQNYFLLCSAANGLSGATIVANADIGDEGGDEMVIENEDEEEEDAVKLFAGRFDLVDVIVYS